MYLSVSVSLSLSLSLSVSFCLCLSHFVFLLSIPFSFVCLKGVYHRFSLTLSPSYLSVSVSLSPLSATMTHASIVKEERERLGITDSLVRLSVGVEDVLDLVSDINDALNAAV